MATVGFAGMTHLGLNTAVAAAALGCSAVCYDPDPGHGARLAQGRPHVHEPDLERLMAEHRERLAFTAQVGDLAACPLVVVAPDIPTDDQGRSDLSGLRELIGRVDAALPAEAVLVVLSQVPPGFCRQLQLKPGRRLHYQVETLIFGQAVARALHPERFIVGCADPARDLPGVYRTYLELFGCPILPMRFESAELAKISINCCLVASVGVANTLAEVCEHVGADWAEIVPALKLDRRIGPHAYLAPGLGIAGGNLERDLETVIGLADRHGTDARIVRAWIENSRYRKNWVLRELHRVLFGQVAEPLLAVWGLAYKQDTRSTKNSAALELIGNLRGQRIRAYDPEVDPAGLPGLEVEPARSPLEACEQADALAIMTPWAEFKAQDPAEVLRRMRGRIILDPYRVLADRAPGVPGITYLTLGVGGGHA
jgi:UDPglucose 6-dehydrogenase